MTLSSMRPRLALAAVCAVSLSACAPLVAQKKAAQPQLQPQTERLDLDMYSRIRDEGFNHSHVMDYASALFDGIGPRLTGSPAMKRANDWTRDQMAAMGLKNAHLESWGDFGMAWTQNAASMELVKPAPAVFQAQATPWSPATKGPQTAEVVAIPGIPDEAAMAKWKGKLAGKVVLYGPAPKVSPDPGVALEHYDAKKLAEIGQYPLNGDMQEQAVLPTDMSFWRDAFGKRIPAREKVAKFLADEGVVAVISPGGENGKLSDDNSVEFGGWYVYQPQHRQTVPGLVVTSEAFGRMSRLLSHDVPVSVRVNVDSTFGDEHSPGYNTLAEIPGTDPKLKEQVVMVGGHLDSWIAGTGATDNGAGAVVAMEAMRILSALGVQPRRTIRIGLWSGEEQGIYGSMGYVRDHLATVPYSKDPQDALVPVFVQQPAGPVILKPEGERFAGYFNMDNGTGKLLGIYAEGNAAIAPIFTQWMAPLHDLGMTTVSLRNTGSTDHVPFQQAGLPGFQFIQDPRDYENRTHHSNLDTYERLSPDDMKQAAVIEAIFLYNTAQRDEMLPRPTLPPLDTQERPLHGLWKDIGGK